MAYGTETTQYWRTATSIPAAWALAFLFLLLCYGVLRLVEYARIPTIESTMRWLCD